MLKRYAEQILGIYNYIDGVIVTNTEGIVEYYATYRPEFNNLKEEEAVGKHLFEVYPTLDKETSSIFRVLKTNTPIYNEYQNLTTFKGQSIYAVNTTLPIKSGDKTIGVVDISRYIEPNMIREDIKLSLKENKFDKKNKLFTLEDIVTDEPSMKEIKKKIERVSKTDSSVLIFGKTGTGKELVAQSLHTHSIRFKSPFISQNCAAIPSTLLESILFGTVKGSYTGAENRKGLFELAQGGTLFLDEINSMEIGIQAKLLKAIEEKRIWRVGGTTPIDIDIRIVSAVNEDPQSAINSKKLREDLFFRLGVVQIKLPPLSQRKKDIKYLTKHFINKYNREMNRNIIGVSEDVEEMFRLYSWPGNVRELKNVIECAFNLTNKNIIEKVDLPDYLNEYFKELSMEEQPNSMLGKLSLSEMMDAYEKKIIEEAISISDTSADAARLLKISKQTLNYKLEKYKINKE